MPWFEELRKLRVAQLKRELEHYDNSIGTLQIKLKKLKSEREKSLQIGAKQLGKAVAQAYQADGARSISSADARHCSGDLAVEGRVPGEVSGSSRDEAPHATEPQVEVLEKSLFEKAGKDHEALENEVKCGEALAVDTIEGVKLMASDQRQGDAQKGVESSEAGGEGHSIACLQDDETKSKEGGGGDSNSAEILAGSRDADASSHLGEEEHHLKGDDMVPRTAGLGPPTEGVSSSLDRDAKSVVPETLLNGNGGGEREAVTNKDDIRSGDLVGTPTEHSLPPLGDVDHHQGSGDVTSPRLKKSLSFQHRRGPDDGNALVRAGAGKETSQADQERADVLFRESGDKTVPECKQNLLAESADSTEDKQQEEVPGVSESKQPGDVPPGGKERLEMPAPENSTKAEVKRGHQSLASRELPTTSGPLKFEDRNLSTSSTENSELREVWGESAEVVDKKTEALKKKERVTGWGRKRKQKKSISKDLASTGKEEREANNPLKRLETSVKTESVTTSREGSGSIRDQGGKEGNDCDTEAWHQMERFSGDSRVEKSEVGSFVDGNEDISPMSRRNRREPKVSGKLLPLLECLRTICAHKCAPLFKHNQESQDNPRYDRLIKAPLDLGMIRSRLEEGQYSGSLHFFRDLLLMVNNALVYYTRDSQEFIAATGLRECVVKEMASVLETEALLKQEGPSFRKRDFRVGLDSCKGGQPIPGKQGKRKGMKRSLENDAATRDTAKQRAQPDVGGSVDSHDISGNQNRPIGEKQVSMAEKSLSDTRNAQKNGTEAEMRLQNEILRGHKSSDGLKMNLSNPAEEKESREAASDTAANVYVEDRKVTETLANSRDPILSRKGSFAKAIKPKTTAVVSNKGAESSVPKTHAAIQQPDIVVQEPVKRGVGRPPKHSQQQVLQKPKGAEPPNPPRKRVRR